MKDENEEETENESEVMTTDMVSNDDGATVDETVQAAVLAAAEAAGNAVPDSGSVDDGAGEDSSAPPTKRRRIGTRKGSRPWNDMLFELLKFRQANGNLMVPFKSGGDLGTFVSLDSYFHCVDSELFPLAFRQMGGISARTVSVSAKATARRPV